MNYGHPLEFGTFVEPVNRPASTPVELAVRSEELGFDLVTFQDHPYVPTYLDTWTLLSWVAGRTSRIRLSANVLNLPLRTPAVLARSAASLDLLSGGRLELAIGAGARPYAAAIEAMGGPRLSPGEAVRATSEAIDVIRGLLDAGEPTPLRVRGERYHVEGVGRGPLPAHHIPLWLGARQPRMLRLLGAKADGWVVSQPYVSPPQLRDGNKIIDEAAEAAGRDPADIRRLLNISGGFAGTPQQWVDELLPLAVEDGFSVFILMADDPDVMARFAREVAPALRQAVDRELAAPLPTGAVRSSAVRRRRREGIDYDGVPASLAASAVEPGDIAYASVRSTYLRGGSPGLVLRPSTTGEVVEALAFARAHPHLPLGIRSGGHGISGRSTNDGGIVVDLGRMNQIEVLDEASRLIRVGPGARWKQVATALAPYGWALTSGDYGGVGVGGLATAGGIGFLGREQGLTIDHVRAAEVVLADGSVVRADAHANPDLFWALRGAGANFGIVTSFEFEVDPVAEAVGWATFVFDASETAAFLESFGTVASSAPRDTTAFLIMGARRRGQPVTAQLMALVDSADAQTIVDRLQPFAQLAPVYSHEIVVMPYASVMNMFPDSEHQGQGEPISRTGFVHTITPEFARETARLLESGTIYFFQIRTTGGAASDVEADATAYAHRDVNFSVTAMGVDRRLTDARWDGMRRHFDGLYLSFETDQRPERLGDAFPPATLRRLRELKARYDPDNVFRDNFSITAAKEES
jgi:alkanesulfonate monooxygenase SsuD/methylene tetrahydromethanopterin reductase-like flavin-dependent oxidoreductase (luciferase family)